MASIALLAFPMTGGYSALVPQISGFWTVGRFVAGVFYASLLLMGLVCLLGPLWLKRIESRWCRIANCLFTACLLAVIFNALMGMDPFFAAFNWKAMDLSSGGDPGLWEGLIWSAGDRQCVDYDFATGRYTALN